MISISAPANNSAFTTTRINVRGTFTESSLKRITVNGVPAFVTSGAWEALSVPLAVGANTITATAEDLAGNTGAATITVTGNSSPVDPVQLTATPVGGFAPLQVTFQVQSSAPGTLQQVLYDFTGDNTTFQTATDLQPITHTYSTSGQYFPVVTLVTSAGRFSSSGGWNAGDPTCLRINVQPQPQQVGAAITVTDPVDLKATADGKLYVLSRSTATILEYDTTTTPPTLIRSKSGVGTTPTGLDVDGTGNVYVAISGDNQVAKFNPTSTSFQLDPSFGYLGESSAAAAAQTANSTPRSMLPLHQTVSKSRCRIPGTTACNRSLRPAGNSPRRSANRAAGTANSTRRKGWCTMESATCTSLIPGTTGSCLRTGLTFWARAVPLEMDWGNFKDP